MAVDTVFILMALPTRSSTTLVLTRFDIVSEVEGWAATDDWVHGQSVSAMLHFTNGQWDKVEVPDVGYLFAISMLSASEGWAVGPNGLLNYDGQNWIDRTDTISPEPFPLTAIPR